MEGNMVTERILMRIARVVSAVFSPFSIPFLAFLLLLLVSYLHIMPLMYKLTILALVFIFTILTPILAILTYCRLHHLKMSDLNTRGLRFMPFIFTIVSYGCCLAVMRKMNIPWYMSGIILAALLMQLLCIIFNLKWKLSEHMAGAGAIIGGVVAFSELFGYNPVWWLCIIILMAGVLGSARITLGHHSIGEVLGGLVVGMVCSLLVLHPLLGMPFSFMLF